MFDVHTRATALEFLRKKGTKVAVQIGHDGDYVFVEKSDFIKIVLQGPKSQHYDTFVDYDGRPESAFIDNNVLHLPIGIQ